MTPGRRGKPELGRHDYNGLPPQKHGKPFSVGIFRWVKNHPHPDSYACGLKRSPVICRVKGLTSAPEMVYEKAEEICRALDLGGQVATNYYALGRTFTAKRRAK